MQSTVNEKQSVTERGTRGVRSLRDMIREDAARIRTEKPPTLDAVLACIDELWTEHQRGIEQSDQHPVNVAMGECRDARLNLNGDISKRAAYALALLCAI